MTGATTAPMPLSSDAQRLVVYSISDRRGDVDEYIPYALTHLRPHAAHILAIVDGVLSPDGREALRPVVDEIIERSNTTFHLWAYRAAVAHLGPAIANFDEVLFTADRWYGPISPFGPVFERMDAEPVDFWGMTEHGTETPNPFTGEGSLAAHLQPHWFAVRSRMTRSEQWKQYWDEMTVGGDFAATALRVETELSEFFREAGFLESVAFPATDYPTTDPSLLNAELLISAGCPILRRRPFADWPPYLDRHSVVGRWTLKAVEKSGFPTAVMLQNLARNVPPKVLNTDAAMLEVLPEVDVAYDASRPLQVAVVAHIFYDDLTDELLDHADTLPVPYDLIVTTSNAQKAALIAAIVARRAIPPRSVDIRIVGSNDGRDQSGLYIACRDVLLNERYDLVVKIHSKKTPQDGFNNGLHFREQQLGNLLNSPGYAANVLALFQREAGLGIVFPPMIHVGAATMGRGWATNKEGFAVLAGALSIRVPLDDVSPLAPLGSMFIARPQALRLMVAREWTYADFGGSSAYRDGGLAHILERMPAYAAAELGYHARTVANSEYLSVSHTALDFKLDQISATTMGYTNEQIEFLRRGGFMGKGKLADLTMMHLRWRHPRIDRELQRFSPFRGLKRATGEADRGRGQGDER